MEVRSRSRTWKVCCRACVSCGVMAVIWGPTTRHVSTTTSMRCPACSSPGFSTSLTAMLPAPHMRQAARQAACDVAVCALCFRDVVLFDMQSLYIRAAAFT